MFSILIAVFCFGLGIIIQKLYPNKSALLSSWVNRYLFYLVLPALALLHIPSMRLTWEILIPISAAWFTFLLSWLLFGLLGKKFNWGRNLTGCLIIVAGLANTSFMGFPLIELLYGPEALATALLIDQGGSFLIVSSLSIVVASIYSEKAGDLRSIPLKIISFPPFIFLVLSIAMSLLGWRIPLVLSPILRFIGQTMAPMALLAIALRLSFDIPSLTSRYFWMAMGYRLLLAPALVFFIYRGMLTDTLHFRVTVLESGMAPMITGSLVAIQYDLHPKLASQLAGIGMPISLLSVILWYFILAG
ncbi:AEC family transporter [Algoriphagus namhaensis]